MGGKLCAFGPTRLETFLLVSTVGADPILPSSFFEKSFNGFELHFSVKRLNDPFFSQMTN